MPSWSPKNQKKRKVSKCTLLFQKSCLDFSTSPHFKHSPTTRMPTPDNGDRLQSYSQLDLQVLSNSLSRTEPSFLNTPAGKHELRMPGWYPHNPQAERISFHNQSSWPNMGTLLHIVLENANRDYNSHQTLIPKCNKARIMPSEVFATRSKTKVL